jgi:hypothetical protein
MSGSALPLLQDLHAMTSEDCSDESRDLHDYDLLLDNVAVFFFDYESSKDPSTYNFTAIDEDPGLGAESLVGATNLLSSSNADCGKAASLRSNYASS